MMSQKIMQLSMGVLPPPLDADRQNEVISRLGTAQDKEAKSILVEHNLRLVVHIAQRFVNTGIDMDDLFSIGVMGLMKAVDTFNSGKNIKLATYAARCITNEILMYLRRNKKTLREVSLDEPLNTDADGNELSWSDILGTDENESSRAIEDETEQELLLEAIGRLDEKEGLIIKLRFGIGCNDGQWLSQKDVAELLGITQSYVSRLETKILQRLRRELLKMGF